jgi:hypothetical protein
MADALRFALEHFLEAAERPIGVPECPVDAPSPSRRAIQQASDRD